MGEAARSVRHAFFAGLVSGIRLTWPVLSGLIGVMLGLGMLIARIEHWSIFDGIYFAFVTGLTVGYGDLVPKLPLARVLAITIGFTGILLTGMVAAISVQALQKSLSAADSKEQGGTT